MTHPNSHLSDLSDKSLYPKIHVLEVSLSPLALFHNLRSKGINPINPINAPEHTSQPMGAPIPEPKFTPAEIQLLTDFYASRPLSERKAMHTRAVYLRADRCWDWESCDCQAYHEGWIAAGSPPGPFKDADDHFNDRVP